MKNISQIIRKLEHKGFRLERGNGSKGKLYPPDKTQPFYSLHIGEKATHPLKRFARANWNLDLEAI